MSVPTQAEFVSNVREFIGLLQGRIGELDAKLASKRSLLLENQVEFTKINKANINAISNEYYEEIARNIYGKKMIMKSKILVEYETLSRVIKILEYGIETLTTHIRKLNKLLVECTNFVSDPSIPTARPLYDFLDKNSQDEISTRVATIDDNIYAALGYDKSEPPFGSASQGEWSFKPIPENLLHTSYKQLVEEYKSLYGTTITQERREAERVTEIAAKERQAEYKRMIAQENEIQKIINPIWTWIFEVEERMENPGNTSYIPFSKKVVLPDDIREDISGHINALKSVIDDIRKVTPKTPETQRMLITSTRAIYENIITNKGLMKTLKDSYPRLYRAFFINEGRLTKKNGKTNLFKYGRSRDFLEPLGLTSGGKRKIKRTKKQLKQKRRRTIRR